MNRLELLASARKKYNSVAFGQFYDCISQLKDSEIEELNMRFEVMGGRVTLRFYFKIEQSALCTLVRLMPKILQSLRVPKPLKIYEIKNHKPYWLFDGTKFYPQVGGEITHKPETRALASVGFIYAGNLTREQVEEAHAQNSS